MFYNGTNGCRVALVPLQCRFNLTHGCDEDAAAASACRSWHAGGWHRRARCVVCFSVACMFGFARQGVETVQAGGGPEACLTLLYVASSVCFGSVLLLFSRAVLVFL